MDITTFDNFLLSQRDSFALFLKGCKDLDRDQMRIALHTHASKMTFLLTTEYPILGVGPNVSSPVTSTTPRGSGRRSASSPMKSPAVSNPFRSRSPSPPGSNRPFKSPGPVPDIARPRFNRRQASTATPVNTPMKSAKVDSSSKISPFGSGSGSIRTASGGFRHGVTRGGVVGGAARLFKPLPVTPKRKGQGNGADDSDSSAGSPLSDDPHPKRGYHKRTASAKKIKSPFEVVAKMSERNRALDSDSTSDFEIPLGKPKSVGSSKVGVRKISSAKSEKEKITPKKGFGGMLDVADDDAYSEDLEQTPSKKQKIGRNDYAGQQDVFEIDD